MKKLSSDYNVLIDSVGVLLSQAREKAYSTINNLLVRAYWEIGKRIVDYEQKSGEAAVYGSQLFERIALDLRKRYGRGFSRSNVIYMRLLYLKYPGSQTLSDQLGWSHYVELLMIDNDLERSFYQKQCIYERWSVRELKRQKESALFERLAVKKTKPEIMELARKGQEVLKPMDIIKEPYVLEFLGLAESHNEKELEQRIIENLQRFLLELGKGFTFMARQFRISLDNQHYYVDLVFYHHVLKCFILIDLKIGKVTPQDVGQMNLYLNYFKREEMGKGDQEPFGIILAKEKNEVTVEYALGGLSNQLFVSKYKIYLPDKKQLQEQVQKILKEGNK